MAHDGCGLTLVRRAPAETERATLGLGLEHGQPFGVAVSPMSPRRADRSAGNMRSALAHLRALLALDAKAAGTSDLQIARTLLPSSQLGEVWSSDSAERALVRDALKRGRAFRDGRWRDLVWGAGRRPVGV